MYAFTDTNSHNPRGNLPSEALQWNGVFFEDEIPGYTTLYVSGRESYALDVTSTTSSRRDGARYQHSRVQPRDIVVTYQLIAKDAEAFRDAFNKLLGLLRAPEGRMIFNDEPDKFFTGTVTGFDKPEPGRNAITGSITFECLDPFKYSVEEKTVELSTGGTATIKYKGTWPAYPRIEYDMKSQAGAVSAGINGAHLKFGIDEPAAGNLINGMATYGPWKTTTVAELTAAGFNSAADSDGYGAPPPYFANIDGMVGTQPARYLAKKNAILSCSAGSLTGFEADPSAINIGAPPAGHAYEPAFGGFAAERTEQETNLLDDWQIDIDRAFLRKSSNSEIGYQAITVNDDSRACIAVQYLKQDPTSSTAYINILVAQATGSTMDTVASIPFDFSDRSAAISRDTICKEGDTLSVTLSGRVYTFKLPSASGYKMSFWILSALAMSKGATRYLEPAPHMAFGRPQFTALSEEGASEREHAYISGDVLEVDTGSGEILLNGQTNYGLGNIQNDWEGCKLAPGDNEVTAAQSLWSSTAADVTVKYREVYA